ncbi:MAG: NAD(P)-dependent alcohol dehydrogenase [Propionibacteriales bacterium]|nr:NAD(P)-dependent alcohol dehydrogenase [Propionibacteriales bacterium]
MRAVVHHSFGSSDVLRIEQVARPDIADHEVLVRVHSAGLDRGVWHVMTGTPYLGRLVFGLRRPRNPVLGRDLAGTVTAVGARTTRFAVGDEVFGTGSGSFAQYAAAREDKLALKPAALGFAEAAVVPVSATTALQALRTGRVEAGQRVLVIGASGGVGSYAVQLAKAFGAEVTGVASTAKLDLVRALGADHVVDYTQSDFSDGGPYDLVIDIAGNPSLSRLRRALTPTGTAVITGGEEGGSFSGGLDRQLRGMVMSLFGRRKVRSFICKENAADLEELAGLIGSGKVTPSIDRTYPLAQAPDAMHHLETGQVRGKVAIVIDA